MSDYTLILTNIGQAKIADAIANSTQINLTHIAFGDSNGSYYDPIATQTSLVHEVKRIDINNKNVDSNNPNKIVIEGFIPANDYGYQIREMGIFDNTGAMIAVKKYPLIDKINPDTGALIDLYVKEYLVVSSSTVFDLTVDPTAIVATQAFVNNIINNIPLDDYVLKSGDTMTGNLSLPDGIVDAHAVNLGQLNAGLNSIKPNVTTPYSVNSGNTDVNGYADIINIVTNTEISFRVGGLFPFLGVTFPNGKRYEISSIENITDLSTDGAYTFILEEDNLAKNSDGTYSAFATAVKLAYTSEELAMPLMTSNNQDGIQLYFYYTQIGFVNSKNMYSLFDRNNGTAMSQGYGNGDSPDYPAGPIDGTRNWGAGYTIIHFDVAKKLSRMQAYASSTGQPGRIDSCYIYASDDTTNGVDGTWTQVGYVGGGLWNNPVGNINTSKAYNWYRLTPSGVSLYGGYSGFVIYMNEITLWETITYAGGNITEDIVPPENADVSIVPIMTSNTSGGWTASCSGYDNIARDAFNAFDGVIDTVNNNNNWSIASTTTSWLKVAKDSGVFNLTRVAVTATDAPTTAPKDFVIRDNAGNALRTLTNQVFAPFETKYYDVTGTGISAVKLDITANNGHNTTTAVAEMKLYTTVTVSDGDYHLFTNREPLDPRKRIASVLQPKQYLKMAKILRQSGAFLTPINFAFNRKYTSEKMTQVANTAYSKNHCIGVNPKFIKTNVFLINKITELGYAVGERCENITNNSYPTSIAVSENTMKLFTPTSIYIENLTNGNSNAITYANWYFVYEARATF